MTDNSRERWFIACKFDILEGKCRWCCCWWWWCGCWLRLKFSHLNLFRWTGFHFGNCHFILLRLLLNVIYPWLYSYLKHILTTLLSLLFSPVCCIDVFCFTDYLSTLLILVYIHPIESTVWYCYTNFLAIHSWWRMNFICKKKWLNTMKGHRKLCQIIYCLLVN